MSKNTQPNISRKGISISDRVHFRMMSLVHETLYGLFRDPYKALSAAGLELGQEVLEVGCGPGFFTIPAAKMVGEKGSVLALDISPLAVEKVQRKIDTAGVTNVETIQADAAQTGLPDEHFDLVFVFGFANPVGEVESIWAELHRLLRPAGILAVEGQRGPLPGSRSRFSLLKRERRISQFKKIE